MATVINLGRQVETITVPDEDGTVACEWKVPTDDGSLDLMVSQVAAALEAYANDGSVEEAVHLQRRVITAVIGEDGYSDVLAYIGGGEPADPSVNVANIGDVFAGLLVWLYDHVGQQRLVEAASMFTRQSAKAAKVAKAARSAGGKGKKRK